MSETLTCSSASSYFQTTDPHTNTQELLFNSDTLISNFQLIIVISVGVVWLYGTRVDVRGEGGRVCVCVFMGGQIDGSVHGSQNKTSLFSVTETEETRV